MELRQGRGSWGVGQGLHQRAVGMEQAPQEGVQGALEQCSQKYRLLFVRCCVEPGVGLEDPHRSLPIQDILGFYDRGYKHDDVGVTVLWQWIGAY